MAGPIPGDAATVLARVQEIMEKHVPDVKCELQDYEHRIGCGAMDEWGNVQDVKFLRRQVSEEEVRTFAQVLHTKLKTGGSTAGPVDPYNAD